MCGQPQAPQEEREEGRHCAPGRGHLVQLAASRLVASRARHIDTREECLPVHSSWRAAFTPEQSSREFAPADAVVGTQDTVLHIAWISLY
jgi:hypothetical protein